MVRFPWIDPILLSKIPGELIGKIKIYILISRILLMMSENDEKKGISAEPHEEVSGTDGL